MRSRLPQFIPALSLASLCLPLALADTPAATQPTVGEPPLEYVLTIDGKDVPIAPDKPTTVRIGDRDLQVRLTPKAERVLKLPGLSVSYPSYCTYEENPTDPKSPQWVIQGRNAMLIITSANAIVKANALETATISALTAKFGDKNVTRTATDINFAGKKVSATRLDFTLVDQKLYYILFAMPTGGATYMFIIQDTPGADGSKSEEATKILGLLDKAVVGN